MPVMQIQRADKLIESKPFRNSFYIILRLDGTLTWESDDEQGRDKQGGVFHIWIQSGSFNPNLSFVRPDWRFTLDGNLMPQGFYEGVPLSGRVVELLYQDYHFLCAFEGQPQNKVADIQPALSIDKLDSRWTEGTSA
jgi:hypothetical protein